MTCWKHVVMRQVIEKSQLKLIEIKRVMLLVMVEFMLNKKTKDELNRAMNFNKKDWEKRFNLLKRRYSLFSFVSYSIAFLGYGYFIYNALTDSADAASNIYLAVLFTISVIGAYCIGWKIYDTELERLNDELYYASIKTETLTRDCVIKDF